MRRSTAHSGSFALAETLCVSPDRIDAMWPHVSGWFQAAVDRCGDWTLEALKDELNFERALLWVLWDGSALKAAAVTQMTIVPRGKVCSVLACGGSRASTWREAISAIEDYAKSEGCVAMRMQGRRGWLRALEGYSIDWVALEKRLD